jgi:hypothetical protein
MKKMLILIALLPSVSFGAQADYDGFAAFRDTVWGAETDSLYYVHFGETMSFDSGGDLVRPSENSAAIAFETTLPSSAWIHYGDAADTTGWAAADTTDHGDGNYFNQLRYITGLTANTQYWYHLVAVDERGNLINSDTRTFTTLADNRAGVRHIDGTGVFPQTLGDSTYVVTANIDADNRAFTVSSNGCVLDLNGFTVTYDNATPAVGPGELATWDEYRDSAVSSFGIKINSGITTATIVGGTIAQGSEASAGDYNVGYGFNPIFVYAANGGDIEIALMTIEWSGDYLSGITGRSGEGEIHHNIITDKGTLVGNRQQGRKAIMCGDWGVHSVYNNLIKRARHQAIVLPTEAYDNEIYLDSWSTNSYGIKPHQNISMDRNKVFGTGYHPIGLGWALPNGEDTVVDSLMYRENFVHMRGTAETSRDAEYGSQASVVGIRHTQYSGSTYDYNNFLVEDNTIIIQTQVGTTDGRGIQITSDDHVLNFVVKNNIFKNENLYGSTTANGCVYLMGQENDWAAALPVVYDTNTFMANYTIIDGTDDYQTGGNHHFRNCTLIKFGALAGYETIRIGYYNRPVYLNRFIDCSVSGGAALNDNLFLGSPGGLRNYAVGRSLWITATSDGSTPIAIGEISVGDNTSWAYVDTTDASGLARLELLEYDYEAVAGTGEPTTPTTTEHTSHEITGGGYTVSVTSEIWNATTSESVPLTINFSSGGTAPGFTFDSASVTDNVLTIGWTDAASSEWQVQATINGTTSYTILVDSASASFPVAAGTIDIKVTGDASGFTQGQASN